MPRSSDLERERHVRFLVVGGRQDDGFWGPVGALWLSEDRRRCGFHVHPYACHCLWSLGFRSGETRVLVHGLFGCLFFGALTANVLVVRTPKMPKLALPVLGGVVFTALTVLWLTSAFWFFTTVEFPGI